MSTIKFSPDLFLDSIELTRFSQFIQEEGYRRDLLNNTYSFGLIRRNQNQGVSFNDWKVSEGPVVDGQKTIQISEGYALNSDGKLLHWNRNDTFKILNDGNKYYIKVSYITSPKEQGIVSIDASGNLVGDSNTKFLTTLRGQPDRPSKIKFYKQVGTLLNTLEYEVLEVVNDQTAILQGIFQNDTALEYSSIGTFTAGSVPSSGSKEPFQYDACFVKHDDFDDIITTDQQFLIGTTQVVAGNLVIEDRRIQIWQSKAEFQITNITTQQNPLIGVDKIKFDNELATKDKNLVYINWSFSSTNWTINSNQNKITINAGQGGKYKSVADFVDGVFNGWRIYVGGNKAKYAKIVTSSKVSSQINLVIDVLNTPFFLNPSDELIIVPDVEEVELIAQANSTDLIENVKTVYTFPVYQKEAILSLLVYKSPSCLYNIQYRYKNNKEYTPYYTFPNDAIGFLTEQSFTITGTLKPLLEQIRYPYVGSTTVGYILLSLDPNAYTNFKAKVDTGDRLGVRVRDLDVSINKVDLVVGTDEQEQIFQHNDPKILIQNTAINLPKPSTLRDGNKFVVRIKGKIQLGAFRFIITQNWVSGVSLGNIIYELTKTEAEYLNKAVDSGSSARIECIYDKDTDSWIPSVSYEVYKDTLEQVLNYKTLLSLSGTNYTKLAEVSITGALQQTEAGEFIINDVLGTEVNTYGGACKLKYKIYWDGTSPVVRCVMFDRDSFPVSNLFLYITEFTVGVSTTVGLYLKSGSSAQYSVKIIHKEGKMKFLSNQPWISALPPVASPFTGPTFAVNGDTPGGLGTGGYIAEDINMLGVNGDVVVNTGIPDYPSNIIAMDSDNFTVSTGTIITYNTGSPSPNFSTKVTIGTAQELKWILPKDNVSRVFKVKFIVQGQLNMSLGSGGSSASDIRGLISFGKTTLITNDTLTYKGFARYILIGSTTIPGGFINSSYENNHVFESIFKHPCTIEADNSIRLHLRLSGIISIRSIRMIIEGTPN